MKRNAQVALVQYTRYSKAWRIGMWKRFDHVKPAHPPRRVRPEDIPFTTTMKNKHEVSLSITTSSVVALLCGSEITVGWCYHWTGALKCNGNNWIWGDRSQVTVFIHQRQGGHGYRIGQQSETVTKAVCLKNLQHLLVNHGASIIQRKWMAVYWIRTWPR